MKKSLWFIVLLGLILAVLLCTGTAFADDPMKVSLELSKNTFSEPEMTKVSVSVTNVGDYDLPGPAKLYYPNGRQVEEFGSPTLAVGESKNWTGSWTVTQKELEAGKITFKIRYVVYSDEVDENGNKTIAAKTKNFSKKIQYTGTDPQIDVVRTIIPTTAQKGQEISIIYDVKNTGSVDVSSVVIKENSSITSKSGLINSIPAGETGSYQFITYMGSGDMTSSAIVSYKANGKTYAAKVEEETIKYSENNISATLMTDKEESLPWDAAIALDISAFFDTEFLSALPESVYVTFSVKNNSANEVNNIHVMSDQTLLYTIESIPAGEEVTFRKNLLISMEGNYIFKAVCKDPLDQTLEFDSPGIVLKVAGPDMNNHSDTSSVTEWPEPKNTGWNILDLTNIPLKNSYTETMTRADLMNNGMLLVNEWHSRPEDFDESGIVSVGKYYEGDQKIQVKDNTVTLFPNAIAALREALDGAKADGLEHYMVEEGYRTYEQQNTYFQNRMDKLSSKYSGDALIAETKKTVNYPGTSEYNSGLGFHLRQYDKNNPDFNTMKYSATDQGKWMNENCWKYGIVFRFPQAGWPLESSTDKSFKTGVSNHMNLYRYVGKGNAVIMHYMDFSMEEYIEFLQKHPHIALFEDGVLKYEIYRQYYGDVGLMDVQLTRDARNHYCSLDNMGAVISVFEY